jgi:hypothetical protein
MHVLVGRLHLPVSQNLFQLIDFQAVVDLVGREGVAKGVDRGLLLNPRLLVVLSRWHEIRACNDNVCGESKSQNSPESLLALTFLSAATAPKAPIY